MGESKTDEEHTEGGGRGGAGFPLSSGLSGAAGRLHALLHQSVPVALEPL